jgi:hypothetical protein
VDPWADPRRDPSSGVAEAPARALGPRLGLVSRAAKAAGLESVTIGGALKVDVTRNGRPDGVTLPVALRTLHETDEAQRALSSEAGEATMSALRSARDQLKRPDAVNLMRVRSGSDRDKLLRRVNAHGAPLSGSQVSRRPLLGREFMDHASRRAEALRRELAPVDLAAFVRMTTEDDET